MVFWYFVFLSLCLFVLVCLSSSYLSSSQSSCSSIVKSFCTFLGDGEQKCQMVVWSSFGHRSFATFSANKIGVRSLLNRKFKNFQERRVWSWSEAKVWLYQYIRQTICAAPPKKEQTFQRHADVSKIQSIYWHHFIKFCLPPHLREI